MVLKRITEPTTQCVAVYEVKEFMKFQGTTSEDILIHSLIKSAENYAENFCKRSIMRQQWEIRIDDFPGINDEIELPMGPLSTAATDVVINYIEDSTVGNTTAIASTALTVDFYSEPGILYPSYDNYWPTPRGDHNSVRITYYTGVSNAVNVPEAIKNWVKLRVTAQFENRESIMIGSGNFLTELPYSFVDGLLDPYILHQV